MQDLVVAKHEIVIDVAKKAFVEIEVVKGSRRSILLKFFFVENGEKFDMQNVKLAEIKGTTPGGGRVFKDLDVLEDGSIEYLISDTIVGESGKTTCELQLIGPYGEVLVCHEISIKVLPNSFDENEYVAEDDISAVRAYVMRAEKAAETSEGVKEYVGKTTESYQKLEEELQQTKEEFENYTDTVKERIENGEFIGPPGIQGKEGKQGGDGPQGPPGIQGKTGESGIVTPASGYFTLSVDEDGNVYANYADEDHPPQFEMDEEMNVYLFMDDDTKVFIGNVKPLPEQVQESVNTYLEEHPVEEGKVDLPKNANGYDYGYAGQVAVGNGAGAVEWKNPEVKYYATLEEMLADEQLYNYMFAVVVGENDILDGRSATYFIYDKPVNGSVKLEKRELYACKIPVWYVSTNEQELTDGQKEQVRENIGAAAKADVEEKDKRLKEEMLNLAIKPTTDPATSLRIQDSANYRVLDMSMQGKTEQDSTTGKQLLDINENGVIDGTFRRENINIPAGEYKVTWESVTLGGDLNPVLVFNDNEVAIQLRPNVKEYNATLAKNETKIYIYSNGYSNSGSKGVISYVSKLMIREATVTDDTYEPYTGGVPSPNPSYPQDIHHAGRYNEETGKYEVDVEICSNNLLKNTATTQTISGINFTVNKDKSVKVKGTATANILFYLNDSNELFTEDIKKGSYALSGCDKGSSSTYYLTVELEAEDNRQKFINLTESNAGSKGYVQVNISTQNKYRTYIYVKSGAVIDTTIYPQLEKGTVSTSYIPHESQKVTLSSPRPFTKWDSLVKKDGLYQWAFKHYHGYFDGTEDFITDWYPLLVTRKTYPVGIYKNDESALRKSDFYSQYTTKTGFSNITGRNQIGINIEKIGFTSKEEFTAFLKEKYAEGKPYDFWYETEAIEYVPVSDEEQAMLEALETYYGVTNISNSEECEMSIQYVADTQLYVNNKVLAIQSAVI